MKVYLCGPINGCNDSECKDWREEVKRRMPDSTIDPMLRDYRGKESDSYREIVDLDKRDLGRSDVILVNYDKPSVGTSMEVIWSWSRNKPVVVVCREGTAISPWLRYHSTKIVHSFDAAINWIKEVVVE